MIVSDNPQPFEVEAKKVVHGLRGAFEQMLVLAGADPQDPQSIAERLSVNKSLAWKISKIVQADDPSVVLQQMPGGPGLKIFLKANEKAGVSGDSIRAAREAIGAYDELIRVHSGDRLTMEMMGGVLSPRGRPQSDEHHRKQLFHGASYVWGVQTRVLLKVGLVCPGSEDGLLDFASMNAMIGFRRLRPDVVWPMAVRHWNNDDGTEMTTAPTEPIDPRFSGPEDAPLLPEFCSNPLPELRRHLVPGGVSFELVEGRVGNTGSLDCVFGLVQRHIPYYRDESNIWGEHSARCDTPSELLIVDLYIHRDLPFRLPPEALLFSEMGVYPALHDRRVRLPLHEQVHDLGDAPLPVVTPEVRRYNQMVQTVFKRTGWNHSDFRGFRMKVPYPACPTSLKLRYPLPDRPA